MLWMTKFQNNLLLGGKTIKIGEGRFSGSNNLIPYGANDRGLVNSVRGGGEQVINNKKNRYFLHKHSLAINQGTSQTPLKVSYMPTPNAVGVKRPKHGRLDIGAFEF